MAWGGRGRLPSQTTDSSGVRQLRSMVFEALKFSGTGLYPFITMAGEAIEGRFHLGSGYSVIT